MPEVFINLDARYLAELADYMDSSSGSINGYEAAAARLLQIARHLQKMDDRSTTAYARGFQEGKASTMARSNLVKAAASPRNLEEAMANWSGEITKLDPVQKKAHDNTLTIDDLDLDL